MPQEIRHSEDPSWMKMSGYGDTEFIVGVFGAEISDVGFSQCGCAQWLWRWQYIGYR
jgi:hypothetical protein